MKGFCEIFYFCFRFHRRIPQSACGCQLSTRHALRVPFQGSLDTNEPPLSGEAFLPCEFSSTKLPRRGIQAAAAAVTLPFSQLKLGRKVSGDPPPAVTLPFLQLKLGRRVSGGLLSLSKSAVAISAGRRADSPRKKEKNSHSTCTIRQMHRTKCCLVIF